MTEKALNADMDIHLIGNIGAGNGRNDYDWKTVITDIGTNAIEVPRNRRSTFDPQPTSKYRRRFLRFNAKIISMYAHGMSSREIFGRLRHHESAAPRLEALPEGMEDAAARVVPAKASSPSCLAIGLRGPWRHRSRPPGHTRNL